MATLSHIYKAIFLDDSKPTSDESRTSDVIFAENTHKAATKRAEEIAKLPRWRGYKLYWVEHITSIDNLEQGNFIVTA